MGPKDDSGRVEKTAHRYAGYDAYDSNGEKVGYVDDLFVDRVNGQEYIELNMGFLGMKSTVIPMEVCTVDDQRMVVDIAQSRTKVRKAPRKKSPLIGDDVMAITPDYEDRVRKYFGLEEVQPAADERTFSVYSQAYASKEEPAGGEEAPPAKPRVRRRKAAQEPAAVEPRTPEPETAEQPGSVEPEPIGEPAALEPETVEVPPEITPEPVEVPAPIEFEPVAEPSAMEPEPVEIPEPAQPEPAPPEPVEQPAAIEPEPTEQPATIEPEPVEQVTAAGTDDRLRAEEPEGGEADRATLNEEPISASVAEEAVVEAAESAPVRDRESVVAVAGATGPDKTHRAEETERVGAGSAVEPAQASTGGSVAQEEGGEGAAVRGSMGSGQVRENRQAPQGLQQQAMQAMVQGSVNAYANLMSSALFPILLYQQSLMTATQVALGGVRATTRATRRRGQSSR